MRKLRVGYVGCGFMGQKVHIPNLVSLSDRCELVALAEVRPKLGKKVQERYKIPRLYAHHRELCTDKELDAVAISGAFSVQSEIAIDLLNAGKDVFVEKPMAISVEQGERILAAEKASGKRLMVAYMKRHDPGNIKVKAIMDEARASGSMGKLRYVRNHGFGGDWTGGLDTPMDGTDEPYPASDMKWPSWLPEKFRKGYIDYLQQYTHNINLVRWLIGADGLTVKSTSLDPADGWRGVVTLDHAGVPIVVESGWIDYEGWDEHTQCFFDGGWVRTEAPALLLKNVPATIEVYKGGKGEKSKTTIFPDNGRAWSYREEMRTFLDCVRDGTPLKSPASDTLHDVRILEDVYKAHIAACGGAQSASAARG